MLVAWTLLVRSRREQALRRVARVLGYSTALVLFGATVRDGSIEPGPALAALLAAVGGYVAGRWMREEVIEIGVDDAGCLVARRVGAAAESMEQRLRCVFAAPWLITVSSGTMWVAIWPDSVAGNIFRRLWVHTRWNPGRQPAEHPAATAPIPPG